MAKKVLCTFMFVLLVASVGFGQTDTGRITGTVTDATGAVVPGSTLTFIHLETNRELVATSDERGTYTYLVMPIGNYRAMAESPGFKRVVRTGITLQVGQTAVVDLTLEVGEVTEQVEVTAAVPLLKTEEASQGNVIDSRKIVDLPLNGRDYLELALISAGTLQASGAFGGFSANGMRNSQNNYMLDGMDNNNNQMWGAAGRGEAVKPSVDAVQEFKVLTGNYSAEYGRAAGGIVNVALKSGTNELHGTVFGFMRNEALDARNFFAPSGKAKPPFKRSQFGFALGGPIVRNRTFLFGDYEGTRIRESAISNRSIPTLKMQEGDLSELPGPILDPNTYDAMTNTRQPFENDRIPLAQIDPVAGRITERYQPPTKPGLGANFLHVSPDHDDIDKFDIRTDHAFSSNDNVYFRLSSQDSFHPPTVQIPGLYGGFGNRSIDNASWNAGLVWTHIVSPTLITSSRVGYNKLVTLMDSPEKENLNAKFGIKGVDTTTPGAFASFGMSGYSRIGLGAWLPNYNMGSRNRQVKNDTSWITGAHTLKFGVEILNKWSNQVNPEWSPGGFSFNGAFTRDPITARGGDAFADFLLGMPVKTTAGTNQKYSLSTWVHQFYIQDDWKVTRRLTLNLGLRYELLQWPVEANNLMSNVDIDTDPNNIRLVPASDADRGLIDVDKNNFSPRIGLAYQVKPNTVFRGSYGIFFANNEGGGDSQFMARNPPHSLTVDVTTDNITPVILLKNGVPSGTVVVENLRGPQLTSFERDPALGYSQQWTFNIQHQFLSDWVFEAGYYGNKSDHLMWNWGGNYALPGAGDLNSRRRWRSIAVPGTDVIVSPLSYFDTFRFDSNAEFHSLQAKLERQFTAGLTILASYNWSKTMSDAGCLANQTRRTCGMQNPIDRRAEWSLDDQHVGHRFVGSYLWSLPFGRGHRWASDWSGAMEAILGGWNVTGVVALTSGLPFALSVRGNPSSSSGKDRPNVVGNPEVSNRTLARWFDTTAFERNAAFTFGNLGRNTLTGPPLYNLDFGALKDFPVTERTKIQLRFEAFNFFNTPYFNIPGASLGTGSFGRITRAGRQRNLQLGIKIVF